MSVRKLCLWTLACAAVALLAWPLAAQDKPEGEPQESIETWTWGGPVYPPPDGGSRTVYQYDNLTPVPVPDNSCPAWTTSVTAVPDGFQIVTVKVGIWMTHTWRSDIEIQLQGPDGTTVLLIADADSSADNLNVLFDDSASAGPDSTNHAAPPPYYANVWWPAQALSAFRGRSATGNWTLGFCDDTASDTGTLQQWSLFLETDVVALDPAAQSAVACPNDVVPYQLDVFNGTATAQSFALSYTGNLWTVTGPAATSTLPSFGGETIGFTHTVPGTAIMGDLDTVTVTATGTQSDTATATSMVPVVAGWGDLANLAPPGRPTRNHSTVYYNGKLYKIGGYDGAARAYVDIYDIATDTWTTGADMPGARYWQDCVEIGAKIYCAGGYLSSSTNTLYIYDVATNAWTTGATLPANRYNYAGVALGGKYYVNGGYTTTYQATTVVYDPVLNTWNSTMPNMSVARRYHHAGVIAGKIYVAGGYNPSYLSSAEVYDPVANAWSAIASMPSSWVNGGDGVLADRFLVIDGGASTSTSSASTVGWAYDAVANQWALLPYMDRYLYGAEGDSDGTTFWIASGRAYDGSAWSYSVWTTRAYTCADRTDLAITKDDGATTAIPGAPVTYTITATNLGPAAVRYATVFDDFPGLSNVTWTCVPAGTGVCTASGVGPIDDTVHLAMGDSVTYTATGDVASGATGTLDNTASVYHGSMPDLVPANNQATDSDTLTPVADLIAAKDDGLADATLGETVTYAILAANPGPSDAPGCTVADTFPAQLVNVTWTCAGSGGGTCTASGVGNIADTADLPAGGSVTYTATAQVDFAAPAGPIDNYATVTPAVEVIDPDPNNNTALDSTTVVFADLAITKDDGVEQVAPGEGVTYIITVANNGPDGVTGARVVDTFVAELLNVTWTCVGSGGGICTAAGVGNIADAVILPSAATVVYTVDATVDPNARGVMIDGRPSLVNVASVFSNVDVADPDLSNNSAADVDTIEVTDVDLVITKTDYSCYVLPGDPITYTITVTNAGPAAAELATVEDVFPVDFTGVNWTCVASGGATCTPSGSGDINDIVNVPFGGSVVYEATGTVSAGATGTIANTATVAPAAGITDLDLVNNSSTDTNALELPIFCDGFESGNTDAWSEVLP